MGVATYLFKLEDVLVEVILQVLVGVVDAELLKAVAPEVLKPKDVQHPDGVALEHTHRQTHTHEYEKNKYEIKSCI